jgi:hypothetical protein
VRRTSTVVLCLTLSGAMVMGFGLADFGDQGLYSSAWAKDGGGKGGGSGGSDNGKGKGKSGGSNSSGKSGSNVTGSAQAKSSAVSKGNVVAANSAVAMAQQALVEAIQAFETALAEPGTNTDKLLTLERAITDAEKSLGKASGKAAALNHLD